MTIERMLVGKRLSEIAVHGNTVYLAGQVAEDNTQDISGQTRQVLAAIDKLLGEAGSDKSKLLQVTIFIADMQDFPSMNAVWDGWIVPGATPPRATVEAKLAKPEWKVEMLVVAAR
ncbi:MAG: RidA family protein [Rhodocyclaceae bacterium]|jgi:enamine deaminase RidA (YjgF/YER057c/UK114 family)|nr:RidA family protein [Rhodocyclaceae bacterium]MCE2723728.1 RidA family protein [Betaproteobacteria bacterium]MCA3017636.1 RidA family protein [Rhodocyclaceae bacterium]MCA3022227.1 RidA family protein [Rhodocyclaceae bacterium]MCA3024170.1 RidA family protein [Rhodocyclaceae bacterium]